MADCSCTGVLEADSTAGTSMPAVAFAGVASDRVLVAGPALVGRVLDAAVVLAWARGAGVDCALAASSCDCPSSAVTSGCNGRDKTSIAVATAPTIAKARARDRGVLSMSEGLFQGAV